MLVFCLKWCDLAELRHGDLLWGDREWDLGCSLRMVCGGCLLLLPIHLGVGNGEHLNKTNITCAWRLGFGSSELSRKDAHQGAGV